MQCKAKDVSLLKYLASQNSVLYSRLFSFVNRTSAFLPNEGVSSIGPHNCLNRTMSPKQLSSAWVEHSWAHLRVEYSNKESTFRFWKNFHNLEYPLDLPNHKFKMIHWWIEWATRQTKYWCFEWLHCHLTHPFNCQMWWILPLLVGTAKYGLCEFNIQALTYLYTNVHVKISKRYKCSYCTYLVI